MREPVEAPMVHDGPSRSRPDTSRDGHAEDRGADAYLKQYVEAVRGEPVRWSAGLPAYAHSPNNRQVAAAYRRMQ